MIIGALKVATLSAEIFTVVWTPTGLPGHRRYDRRGRF
jgi:hypothetical protein